MRKDQLSVDFSKSFGRASTTVLLKSGSPSIRKAHQLSCFTSLRIDILNIIRCILVFMENCDLSFTTSLIVTGLIVRMTMVPFYYFVEQNQAKKLHAQNIIAARISEVCFLSVK